MTASAAHSYRASDWLVSRRYDLTFLIANAAIVPIALALIALGLSGDWFDVAVTALVGGPHLFATFSTAAANRTFRTRHPWALPSAVLIPLLVVWLSIQHYQILISLFLGAASFHVLHQCAHLCDFYRAKAGHREMRHARVIDQGLLFTSMYPIALYKITRGEFFMGGAQVSLPPFLMTPYVAYLEWLLFAGFALAWIAKTIQETARGELNRPKTMLIAVTAVLSFIIPGAADKDHMGLAFQSMNAWHSMQYLGFMWLLHPMRSEGDLGPISRHLGGLRGARWFYFGNLGVAVLLFIVTRLFAQWNPLGITEGQNYYMFVLAPLLVHYYLDAFTFFGSRPVRADVAWMARSELPAV